jgi:heme/copper-type cytochrome/quinol oxidase subunit 2
MVDITGLSVTVFFFLFIFLRIIIVMWAIWLGRRIYKDAQGNDDGYAVWKKNRLAIVLWVIAFIGVIFYYDQESAYRPKTVIENPAQYERDRYLLERENAETPKIKPSAPLTPMDGDKAEEYYEKSRDSNAKAKEEFMKLPDAGE